MSADFDRAFEILIDTSHEGGYSNNPLDPGGETKYGISKRAFPDEDIKNLTPERAKVLYKEKYWDKLRCGDMPRSLSFSVFDCGVNCGVTRSAEFLQKLLRVTVDAKIGPKTLEAVSQANGALLAAKFNAMRLQYHASLPSWPNFGKGWARRIAENIMLIGD